ncbi:MAG: hypothetical protein JOS17DRAFT_364845 [Linnemannia elongata]|nr:MAG: hypothetical protein JOS17DRAFT_364845 [Linnemannia elongata]
MAVRYFFLSWPNHLLRKPIFFPPFYFIPFLESNPLFAAISWALTNIRALFSSHCLFSIPPFYRPHAFIPHASAWKIALSLPCFYYITGHLRNNICAFCSLFTDCNRDRPSWQCDGLITFPPNAFFCCAGTPSLPSPCHYALSSPETGLDEASRAVLFFFFFFFSLANKAVPSLTRDNNSTSTLEKRPTWPRSRKHSFYGSSFLLSVRVSSKKSTQKKQNKKTKGTNVPSFRAQCSVPSVQCPGAVSEEEEGAVMR